MCRPKIRVARLPEDMPDVAVWVNVAQIVEVEQDESGPIVVTTVVMSNGDRYDLEGVTALQVMNRIVDADWI